MSNTELEKEMAAIRHQLEKTHAFAEKLPAFKEIILRKKYTSDEKHIRFGDRYNKLPLAWGINRNLYKTDSLVTITNYDYEVGTAYECYLFSIYINSSSLFDNSEKFGLKEAVADLDLFFFDKLNSTFYATDEQIIPLLDALDKWHTKARSELNLYNANKLVIRAKKDLEVAETHYNKLLEAQK